jgi:transcriptional regulator NrdR family protein
MLCPNCGYTESRIIRTTHPAPPVVTRRRRECARCKERFSTLEHVVVTRAPVEDFIITQRRYVLQMLATAEDLAASIRELLNTGTIGGSGAAR